MVAARSMGAHAEGAGGWSAVEVGGKAAVAGGGKKLRWRPI
jgi:hypothetical protein